MSTTTNPTPITNPSVTSSPLNKVNKGLEKKTGAFIQLWPEVQPGNVHFKRAWRRTKEIKIDSTIKNVRNAQRKYSAQWIDALMKGLTVPLTEVLNLYKRNFMDLHPFERTVAKLTIASRVKAGHPDLEAILNEIKALRAQTSRMAKDWAGRAGSAANAAEAKTILQEAQQGLEALYTLSKESEVLQELVELHKALRSVPVLSLSLPTVALVGMPNVGKSSLVRALSTGLPEVNSYPFTTRGVTIGHIYETFDNDAADDDEEHEAAGGFVKKSIDNEERVTDEVEGDNGVTETEDSQQLHYLAPVKKSGRKRRRRFQVMDTPGLLNRPDEERNEMEQLTFASLLHLPTAVIFVFDVTSLSGEQSSLDKQIEVRRALRQRFPKRPWVDVITKSDKGMLSNIEESLRQQLPPDALYVSVRSGDNMTDLKERVHAMLESLEHMLRQQGKHD
eukprot:gene3145-3444_t